jgi:hypothetical protein
VSRYRWNSWDGTQDAYDEGYRERSCWRNPHERYGDYEEEQRHRAYEEGCRDARWEEERREEEAREEQAREAAYQRQMEEDAAIEQAYYDECKAREQEPTGPEGGDE